MISRIAIQGIAVQIEIGGQRKPMKIWEFEIDGTLLSERLGIDRSDLRFCMSDLDCGPQNKAVLDRYFMELRGEVVPSNQFGSGRLRLYGCHCGCDYCGVISVKLVMSPDTVEWQDFRLENEPLGPVLCDRLTFRKSDYMKALSLAEAEIYGEIHG